MTHEKYLQEFDELISRLPERVNETPRSVLKDFISTALSQIRQETIEECIEVFEKLPSGGDTITRSIAKAIKSIAKEALSLLQEQTTNK